MRTRRHDRGFTTTEMLVGMVLALLVGAIALGIVTSLTRSSNHLAGQLDAEAKVVNAVVNVGTDVTGSSEITYADSDELVARTSLLAATPARFVRYAFVDGNLVTSAVSSLPAGFPAKSSWKNIPTRTVITDLTSASGFSYLTRAGKSLTTLPMTSRSDLTTIGLIRTDLTARVAGGTVDRFGLAAIRNTGTGSNPGPLLNVCTGITATEIAGGVQLNWNRIVGVDSWQLTKDGQVLQQVSDPGAGNTITITDPNTSRVPVFYSAVPVADGMVGTACDSARYVTRPVVSDVAAQVVDGSSGQAPTIRLVFKTNNVAALYQVVRSSTAFGASIGTCDTTRPEQCREVQATAVSYDSVTQKATIDWTSSNGDTWAASSKFSITPVGFSIGDQITTTVKTGPSAPSVLRVTAQSADSATLAFTAAKSVAFGALPNDIGVRFGQSYVIDQRQLGQTNWIPATSFASGQTLQGTQYIGNTWEFRVRTVTDSNPQLTSDPSNTITAIFTTNSPTLAKNGDVQGTGLSSTVSRDGSHTVHYLRLTPAPGGGPACLDYQLHALTGPTDTMVKTLPCGTTAFAVDDAPTDGKTISYYAISRSVDPSGGQPLVSTQQKIVTMQNAAPPLNWTVNTDDGSAATLSWTPANVAGQLGYGALFFDPATQPSDPNFPFTGVRSYPDSGATTGDLDYFASGTEAVAAPFVELPNVVGGGFTTPSTFRTSPSAPTKPAGTYDPATGNMTVTWPGVSGADGYQVYRLQRYDFDNATLVGTVPATDSIFVDTTVPGSSSLGYLIRATVSAGSSYRNPGVKTSRGYNWSGPISYTVRPPTNLTVTATSGTTATVSWDGAPGASGYYLYRTTSAISGACDGSNATGGVGYLSASGAVSSTPTILTGTSLTLSPPASQCHAYQVAAVYESETVNSRSGFTFYVQRPSATSLAAARLGNKRTTLTWTPPVNSSGSYLMISDAACTGQTSSYAWRYVAADGSSVGTDPSPAALISGGTASANVSPLSCYAFRVDTVWNDSGSSQTSSSATLSYQQPRPLTPTNIVFNPVAPAANADVPSRTTFTWTNPDSAGTDGYVIRQSTSSIADCRAGKLPTQGAAEMARWVTATGTISGSKQVLNPAAMPANISVQSNTCYAYSVATVADGVESDYSAVDSTTLNSFVQQYPKAPCAYSTTSAAGRVITITPTWSTACGPNDLLTWGRIYLQRATGNGSATDTTWANITSVTEYKAGSPRPTTRALSWTAASPSTYRFRAIVCAIEPGTNSATLCTAMLPSPVITVTARN